MTMVSPPPVFESTRLLDDPALGPILSALLTPAAQKWARPVLEQTAAASEQLDEWAMLADKHPPVLHPRDRDGRRTDTLEFHPAYRELQKFAYGNGIIGHYYDPLVRDVLGSGREVARFAHGYLFGQAEQGLFCPICMTDGTAFLVETFGTQDQKDRFLPHLTSRSLDSLWEGAMFLTEKVGGSDVGAIETVARPLGDGRYALSGEKWFCSNAGAELVMVLARVPDGAPGTRGLGLFAMRRHQDNGELNHLHLERLKNKLGTRSMPTGEVILDGAVAEPVGDLSRGFLNMAEMLNLSRLYNATGSLSLVRRSLRESVQRSRERSAFGRPIIDHPALQTTLFGMAIELEAALHLLFTACAWRGRMLVGEATPDERRLFRLAIPMMKYSTARLAVQSASEAVEVLGGNGYIEDWPVARIYRDAQVLPIWEGTTNILVLDAFRAIQKDASHEALFALARKVQGPEEIRRAAEELEQALPQLLSELGQGDIVHLKPWCDRALEVLKACLLAEGAASSKRASTVLDAYLARHFAADRHGLSPSYLKVPRSVFDAVISG